MKKKNIAFASILILIAVYLVVSRLDLIPDIPFFTILFTVIFAYTAIHGFIRLHFFEGVMSLAFLGCIHDKLLGIEAITPWTLLLAGLLVGIALDMIFKNVRSKHDSHYYSHSDHTSTSYVENGSDGETVKVENSFGSISKYVNSDTFREAKIENSFGECNVFFNNTALAGNSASIKVENSFGSTNIYLPATWRIITRQDTAFGNIEFRGHGSMAEGAPSIELRLQSNFGQICIIFES